ncbi:hypothetical protein [Mycobacterium neumannii]|uniref:hypothetical protein n=1 Tax=Mycobacterium neumannii TaxID=2048551 RepID=UPI003AB5FFB5
MIQSRLEAKQRTRFFCRVLGPYEAIVTLIIAIRLPVLDHVAGDLFENAALPWMLGAMMLAMGLVVIAFHQYWYSVTAVLVSLFGWFVALRGLGLMAFPSAIQEGATDATSSPGLLLAFRIFFLLLTAMGLWLTYVGWVAAKPVDNSSGPPAKSASMSHGGNH